MLYDTVLVLGVLFAVGYFVLASQQWSYPLSFAQRTALQTALFLAIGAYFVFCWMRTGQTLALKAWRLKVVDTRGRPPSRARAVARYLLAWHLWLPGFAIAALMPTTAVWTLLALTGGFALLLLLTPALIDDQRRLLHDLWTGTRIVRVPRPAKDQGVASSR